MLPIPAHSIIAVKGDGPKEEGDDGVVAYRSAHIDEAVSEGVVRWDHSCQGHPRPSRRSGASSSSMRRRRKTRIHEAPDRHDHRFGYGRPRHGRCHRLGGPRPFLPGAGIREGAHAEAWSFAALGLATIGTLAVRRARRPALVVFVAALVLVLVAWTSPTR